MAGKLSLELDLKGGETAAQKFRDLNKEVTSLRNNAGKGISLDDFVKGTAGQVSKSFLALNPQLAELGKKAGQTFENARFEAMNDLARRNITGSSQSMINLQAAIAQGDYELNNYKGKAPPVIKQAGGGIGGGGGGRVGKLISFFGGDSEGPLSKIFGALGAFRIALWELEPVIRAVQFAFRHLVEAIQEGSKLYTDSAKLGKSASETSQLNFIAKSLGISTQQAQQMSLYAEFNRRVTSGQIGRTGSQSARGGSTAIGGVGLGSSGRIGMMGNMQELLNLQSQFVDLQKKSAFYSGIQGMNAHELFNAQVKINVAMEAWKTLWSEIATVASGLYNFAEKFSPLIQGIELTFRGWLDELKGIEIILAKLHLITLDNTQFKQQGMNPNSLIQKTQFERLGFQMKGGFGATQNPQEKIATNTKIIADQGRQTNVYLQGLDEAFKSLIPTFPVHGSDSTAHNMP